jgi:archaellum component FlaF (FlaF/FlaG flagellin family)
MDTKKLGKPALIIWLVTGLIALGALFIASEPSAKSKFTSKILPNERTILSAAQGDVLNNGTRAKVLKVFTNGELFIEVYGPTENGIAPLIDQIRLGSKRNGYFMFNGQATTLAIDDVNGDSKLEILAPTFDKNLLAHLNVFQYDEAIKSFQRLSQ